MCFLFKLSVGIFFLFHQSHFILGLTHKEQDLIESLKDRISDIISKKSERYTDAHLHRWIEDADFKVEVAEENIRKSEKWFENNKIEANLKSLSTSEVLKEELPYEISGFSKNGLPVVYVPFGHWNFSNVYNNQLNGQDIRRYITGVFEDGLNATQYTIQGKKLVKSGEAVGQIYLIIDFQGFTLRRMFSLGELPVIFSTFGEYQRNYPLLAKNIFVIRTPYIFQMAVSMLDKVSQRKYLDTIKMFGPLNLRWRNQFKNLIPASSIPANLKNEIPSENTPKLLGFLG